MRDIIACFISPEEKMEELLVSNTMDKWKTGFIYWIKIAVILGLITIIGYKIQNVEIQDVAVNDPLIQYIIERINNEGLVWLAACVIYAIKTLLQTIVRGAVWVGIIWVIKTVLGDDIDIHEIITIIIFSMMTWIIGQLLSELAMLATGYITSDVLSEIISGTAAVLGYWYLILMAVGYSISSYSTFFKSGMIILLPQVIFWVVANEIPMLAMWLG